MPSRSLSKDAIASLRETCRGTVASPEDAHFGELLHGGLWNRLIPDRTPQLLVRVADEQDVIAAVLFAREHKLKVVVRGGGHNWCQPTLRNSGVLIDLSDLNKVISLDVEGRRALIQPIISNREIQKTLNAVGLAFPTGHCPQVKVSGYLLGGGMSWNQGGWGHGAGSVEAVELVTPTGELITASKDRHQDYFWAARGAGSGFFGVVTRYHLRLHPLPKAMHATSFFYPIETAPELAAWLGQLAPKLAKTVELSLFLIEAPAEHQAAAASAHGKVCLVTATSFAETPEQAFAELEPLDACPIFEKLLSRGPVAPVTFEELFDASGAIWPEGLRNRVEATFSSFPAGELARAVSGHLTESPSPLSVILFVFFTGPDFTPDPAEGAYSMNARIYGGPWTMWRTPEEDDVNTAWHRRCVELMAPYISGYYIGESDTVGRPSNAPSAFSPESWHRLADLRAQYDPEGLFFNHFDGLLENKNS